MLKFDSLMSLAHRRRIELEDKAKVVAWDCVGDIILAALAVLPQSI